MGKLHNHSDNPNCHNELIGNKRFLVASRNIDRDEELTTNYRLQPDLEQPQDSWSEKKYYPHIDGYRTYSPFKNLDYIVVNSNAIDCDNIVHDLLLVSNTGKIKFCKKDSGAHYFDDDVSIVVEIPIKDTENIKQITRNKENLKKWLSKKVELIDNDNELKSILKFL